MYGKRGLTIHIHVLATLAGLLTIGLAPAVASAAQISTAPQRAGIIAGVVRDESGLPLPGATVTITAVDGHVLTITRTGSDGSFVARNLPRETVTVDVQLAGFRTTQATVLASPQPDSLAIVLPVPGFTEAVTVTATGREQALASVPSSVGIVSERLLEDAQGLNLAETLAYIPGVTAGDVSGVDDLRISIRGAGVRATFGSRGVLLMVDGVPVTEPDGQTPHVDGQIDLLQAERIEVVKGPASAMYGGAALGGVVNVISRVPPRRPSATMRVEGGSYAFGKAHVSGSTPAGPVIVSGGLGYTHLNGFRTHNSLRNLSGTMRVHASTDASRLTFSLLGTDARLHLPGTLDRTQFEADPSQARPIIVANDWRRDNQVLRFGGRYEYRFGAGHSIELDSYGQIRDLLHPIFAVIDQEATRYIAHVRYRVLRGRHALTVGMDGDAQWVDDRWFVNAGGQPGSPIRDDDNTVRNVGVYAQDEMAFGSRLTVTAGLRADRIRYDLLDRRPQDGDASDRRAFRRVSPKIGFTASLAQTAVVYGNVSTGFEAPTLGEVRMPAGFNEEVRPQKAFSVEAGARGAAGRFSYDIAVYRMLVDDEILPETIDDVTVFRNVARTTHTGVETSVRLRAAPWVTLDATYAYTRFILQGVDAFSGNRLPGIPPHAGTLRASVTGAPWDGFVALTTASSAFVSDANTESAPPYGVISGGIGYQFGRLHFYARGENLGGVIYTNRIQVNDASGFHYYPAPGRHGSAGVEVRW